MQHKLPARTKPRPQFMSSEHRPTTASASSSNAKDTADEIKLPVLEDDDQFSEFDQEDWTEAEAAGNFEAQLWQDDWDDDETKVEPDFEFQLRAEMKKLGANHSTVESGQA